MDGFESEHDDIRGKGNYSKLLKNINLILELQKKQIYKGKLTIHCVLNDKLVDHLFEFCNYIEKLGVDSLYIGYPWYINKQSAVNMDFFYNNSLQFISNEINELQFINGQKSLKSWHTYTYHLNPLNINSIKSEIKKINNKIWKMRLRFQPAVEMYEVEQYILGSEKSIQNKTKCLALSTRIDIRSNGLVIACQPFPELIMGDLHNDSLLNIWHGEKFQKMRNALSKGLSPVCSRCILLYLNGK
jgi:sulfatase maturation enzyme AslB (radical SAM superfamily)